MAINIMGTTFSDLKRTAYDARDQDNINRENARNNNEVMITNIKAGVTTGRVFAGTFPNIQQIEQDLCSWY